MKYISIIIVFLLSQISCFSQKKDSINHQHLVLKFAPFTYFGTHGAIQFEFETNLTPKMTISFDYAHGNFDIASYQTGK